MTSDTESARADLAFMRGLVEGGNGSLPREFGEAYLAGGLIYGLQVFAQMLTARSLMLIPGWGLVLSLGPTVLFLVVLGWIIWRYRLTNPGGGSTSRAVGAVFGVAGFANLALIVVIGSVAIRHRSLEIWLIYPCVVCVLQGAAWLVAGGLRRRAWQGAVGFGWFAAAIIMALCLGSLDKFALATGVAFLLLMALPGAVIIRLARQAA